MPATAGRVRMPANNRVHSSAALQTHGIWQSAIGYDPYAPEKATRPDAKAAGDTPAAKPVAPGESAYDSFQGLLALAKLTGSSADVTRGSCKKCNRVGHLTFQCRNFLTAKDELAVAMDAAALKDMMAKKDLGSEEENEISDSDMDSEMEAAIKKKSQMEGMKSKSSGRRRDAEKKKSRSKSSKKRRDAESESESDSDSDEDSEEERRRSRKEKRKEKREKREKKEKKHRSEKKKSRREATSSEESEEERTTKKKRRH